MDLEIGIDGLIERCQRQLVAAWTARIRATEAAVGDRFGFSIGQRQPTTWIFADGWPAVADQLPFNRVFGYVAPDPGMADPLLQQVIDAGRDAVIEVVPGSHSAHAEDVLRSYGFTPRWQILWLRHNLTQFVPLSSPQPTKQVAPEAWPEFATLYAAAYGYAGSVASAWRTLAEHGYTDPGFTCFVVEVGHTSAAFGVMFKQGAMALIDGAATLPQCRGLGFQKALFAARLQHARAQGCSLAWSRTGLGSISQRNMQKLGMSIFGQSTAWRR